MNMTEREVAKALLDVIEDAQVVHIQRDRQDSGIDLSVEARAHLVAALQLYLFGERTPEAYGLGLLCEEMGEVLQLIGKARRFGMDTPGIKDPLTGQIDMEATPRTLLPKEGGDVMAALDYLQCRGVLTKEALQKHRLAKLHKLLDPDSKDNLGRRLAP